MSTDFRQSRFLQHHIPVRWDIGFTDSSNPFYLFSKLNAGLLLWAPFASTMREEYPLLIALGGGSMEVHAKHRNRRSGSRVVRRRTRLAALTNDDRLMDLRLRDPNSSKNMVALPWEDAE
ncbi:MAG: hypothetical protein H8K03_07785 [Nitrospira sp.]|nr:hypothetical protein [Nitrospira sp. BO4]